MTASLSSPLRLRVGGRPPGSACADASRDGGTSLRRAFKNGFLEGQRLLARTSYALRRQRPSCSRHLPIFCLHTVAPARSDMAVSPERFRRQLAALQDAGYQGLSLSQVIASLKGPGFRPGYALTFDDGYASVLDSGLRILSEAAVPATLFVTIDFIDGKIAPPWRSSNRELLREYELNAGHFRPLDWGQLREIVASGLVEIGSHSMSHPLLATLAPEQAEAELSRSKAILEDRLGVRVRYFSYPFGVRRYGAYSGATEAMVRRVGYEASCTAEPGRVALGDDPFLMPRIPLVDQDGDIDTCAKAAGAYDWVGVAQAAFHHVFPNPHV